jgi:DNA-binding Lrp family transcriptional regulator
MKSLKVSIIMFFISILLLVLFMRERSKNAEVRPNDTITVHDTAWQIHDSIRIQKVPVPYKVEVPVESKPEMLPDTNYARLKEQYMALLKLYINKIVYKDSIKVGDYGYIAVLDTVKENKIVYRRTRENFSIPVVKETKTITKYAPPVRQLYVGGGVMVNNTIGIRGAEAGLLYKTKKDAIYNLSANVDINGNVMYGVNYFYKLK